MSDASQSRKQRTAGETTSEREEQLWLLLENMEDMVSRHLPDSTIVYVSPSCQSLTGYTPEELVQTRSADYVHPDDVRATLAAIDAAVERHDGHYRVQHRLKRKNGGYVCVETGGRLLYGTDGHLREIQCIVRNITKRKRVEEELFAWKRRYESAVESSGHVLYDWNSATNQVAYGGAIEHVLGYSAREMSGDLSRWVELIHPDDRGLFTETIERLVATKESVQFEYRVRRKDGAYIFMEDAGQFIEESHGKITQMIGFVKDVTERNRAEEERQAHLRILECLDQINRPIREAADLEQLLWDTVRTMLSIFDCDRAWLLYPCDPDAPTCRVPVEATRTGYTGACELNLDVLMKPGADEICRTLLDSDGPVTFGRGCDYPLYKETTEQFGIQSQIVVSVHPRVGKPWTLGLHQCSHARVWTVEERRLLNEISRRLADGLTSALTQRELRESEERYRAIAEDIPVLICRFLPDGKITYVNEAYCRCFEKTSEELVGRTFLSLIPQADREAVMAAISALTVESPTQSHEHRVIAPSGDIRWQRWTNRALFDAQGKPVAYQSIGEDITDRRRAEEALEKRIVALTQPLGDASSIAFEELFNLDDIQRLQDEFATATGVASIITYTDGRPLTAPSNFCRLCGDIIRKTDKGCANCFKSDAALGRFNPQGPTIEPCWSGGLWDAGAAILVGGKHIANWLIGQVRNETQTEEKMRAYARDIGADEEAVVEAFREVPAMSREQFGRVAQTLFTLAKQLSTTAYQNVQQARFITERKRAEEALLTEKLLSDEYINSLPGLFYVFDERRFVRWNREWEIVTGYNTEELSAKYAPDFFEGEDKTLIAESMLKVFREGAAETEAELLTKDGRRIPYYFTGLRKVFDGKAHLVGLGMDITDRRHAQREREELIAKLEAQNAELERFTYTVSHDLKSPLITIKGYVGMLRQDLPAADSGLVADDLDRISNAADKMDRLLRDLLEVSRIGRLVNPSVDVSLEELANEAWELVHGQAEKAGVQVEIAPGLPTILGDRVRLLEVLQNLIDNAVKYMGKQSRPRIEIGSRRDGNQTVCYVRDNGIGIEPHYHEKVFELFDQLDQSVHGTGIGLALAKRIVEVHGGRIWVESDGLGHGSTFCFTVAAQTESPES